MPGMRLFLAALFVFAGIMFVVGLLSGVINHISPILFSLGMGVLFLVLVVIAIVMFNAPLTKGELTSLEAQTKELDEKGLLVSIDFNAVRAFQVEEFEDEGLHYFVELESGSVLYLNGQYLYGYQTVEDDDEHNQPRSFPCTQFTVRRHRDEGFVIDIICRGSLLEIESVEPAFQREYYRRGKVPEDGDIITNESFDELKRRIGQTR